MSKKAIIALVATILIWAGFMVYRQYKLDHEQHTRGQKEIERLIDGAKRSPMAGLTQMGSALKKYYMANNTYPPKLMDLYPKYMPSQRFINELDWEYERMEDDFYLSKFVLVGGKPMVAYVDSELRPDIDSDATMASTEERKERLRLAAAESKRRKIKTVRGKLDDKRRDREEEEEEFDEELASLDEITSSPLGEDFQAFPSPTTPAPSAGGQWVLSEGGLEFKQDDSEDAPLEDDADDVSTSISKISESILVWKYKDGVHGFGNIQYPETGRISIAVQGKWRYLNWPASDKKADDEPNDEPDDEPDAAPGEKPPGGGDEAQAVESPPSKR